MCDATSCSTAATTTVQFPESQSDRENRYCDDCMKDVLQAGVKVSGTFDPETA